MLASFCVKFNQSVISPRSLALNSPFLLALCNFNKRCSCSLFFCSIFRMHMVLCSFSLRFPNAVLVFFHAVFCPCIMVGKMPFCKRRPLGFRKTAFYIAICHLLQLKMIPFMMLSVTYCMSVFYLFAYERRAHGCLCPAFG